MIIPKAFMRQKFSVETRTVTIDTAHLGQQKEVWTLSIFQNILCRLDVNKADRYISKTGDYVKSTHIILTPWPLVTTLDVQENRLVVDSSEFRIVGINPVYGRLPTPDHYEIALLKLN